MPMIQTQWLALQTVTLSIKAFTEEIALLTTEVSALVLVLAAASYAIGVAMISTPVIQWWPPIGEHGVRIKNDSIRAIFHISIYSAVVNLVVWSVALINKIG